MRILVVGKRHYTNKDALRERFGRIYRLPLKWSQAGVDVHLALLDYRFGKRESVSTDGFPAWSASPIRAVGLISQARALRPDIILASGDCFIGLAGYRLARAVGAKFVFDVYDDYRAFGAYRMFAGFRAVEFLCRRAALVLFASRALGERIATDAHWALVPNGVDPAAFRPMDMDSARATVNLARDGTRWIGYFGSMEAERGPQDLVAAAGMLHARDPSIRLVLCGRPGAEAVLDAPWVEFRGEVPHAEIPAYINACDVVVLPYRNGPIIDMASSIKIAEYLFCERPIVATRTPNLVDNFGVQASELGDAVCNPGDATDLARAIDAQLRRPSSPPAPSAILGRALP